MNPITVLLADDHAIVREGLLALLKLEDDIKIVGQAENGLQAIEAANDLRPDVIILDISMPLLNGLEATREIIQATPTARILLLSAHSDDAYINQAKALGASGYLLKQTAAHLLPEAIRGVHQGNTFFEPDRRTEPL